MGRPELEKELLALLSRGVDAPLPDTEFNRLALAGFAYQWERNAPYQALCRARGWSPETVTDWREIPAVATDAFKWADLTTVPPESVSVTYITSGTTVGGERRGRHLLPDNRLYEASLLPNFLAHLLPDLEDLPGRRIRMLICGPSARFFPQSSLGHMHTVVMEQFGAAGSGIFWRDDGPRFPCLGAALAKAEAGGDPVCILGTAFGLVHFLDWLEAEGRRYRLPPGSRLMDTGGYKGRSREVPKAELYTLYTERLGIPATHLVNEYGMTELGSQFYDRTLRGTALFPVPGSRLGRPETGNREQETGNRAVLRKTPPPWCRVQVVDFETLAPVPDGTVGLLRFLDLANLHTVQAIQTDDLGIMAGPSPHPPTPNSQPPSFEILGRAAGSEPRGCSLAVEEFLAARRSDP